MTAPIGTAARTSPAVRCVLALVSMIAPIGFATASSTAADGALSALLQRQTQEFSEAGQKGDVATLDLYLDPDVVFTDETGDISTKADILHSAAPAPGQRHITVTHWALRRQGDVATATFIDELTQDFHGRSLHFAYQSTETWAKRAKGWKMIASHTMIVPRAPPAIALPEADLDAYVGVYELDDTYKVTISRQGGVLTASVNGTSPLVLEVEARDVLFMSADPAGRRLFQRDGAGRVVGYVSRRNGNDISLKKVG